MNGNKGLLEGENTESASDQKSTTLFTEEEMKFVSRIDSTGFTFDDVCGMDEAKSYLSLPLLHYASPDRIKRAGFLLFGVSYSNKFITCKLNIKTNFES